MKLFFSSSFFSVLYKKPFFFFDSVIFLDNKFFNSEYSCFSEVNILLIKIEIGFIGESLKKHILIIEFAKRGLITF